MMDHVIGNGYDLAFSVNDQTRVEVYHKYKCSFKVVVRKLLLIYD